MWEAYDAPVIALSASKLDWGASFHFSERSATNGAKQLELSAGA